MLRTFSKKINILGLALRTEFRDGLNRSAVMTFQPVALFVVRHRDAAVHALHRSAAAPAQHRPRIPAPVNQHQRLRSIRKALFNPCTQRGGNWARLVRLLKILPQIHDLHARERSVCNARSQRQQFVFSVPRVVIRFHRWRRGTQQSQSAFHLCAHDGHVAAVIARSLFLLEAVFLLFVHDNKPDIFQRREHRRTCPHHDARLAVSHAPPFARPFHIAQRRVQHRHALEPRSKPRPALPPDPQRQRNLRHQNERRFPARQCLLHCAQIHFRLPAAGHAVEQLYAKFAQFKPRANSFQRALLLRIQFMSWRRIPHIKRILRWINRLLPTLQQSVTQHPLDRGTRHLRQPQKLLQGHRTALRLQQFANSFFSALPLRLCAIFLFSVLLFRFLSRRATALPRDHSLHPSVSSPYGLPNFNEPAALQPLERGAINTKLCRRAKRQCSFLLLQLREKRRLFGLYPVRQFTAAQAVRRFAPRIRQNNLALRFQLDYRRQHGTKNFADWRQVITRDPVRQFDQFRRQRGNQIQHARELANFRSLRRALR